MSSSTELGAIADPPSTRSGRAPATTHGELSHVAITLFLERGFDSTTIDDIVWAAGIGRRTFFRYFPSKNDLPWGDFSSLLSQMRAYFATADPERPLFDVLRRAIIDFNRFPNEELPHHRDRMRLLLTVPSLAAYSTLKYADWRRVIAEYAAARRGESVDDFVPQTIAWASLGVCIGAYEHWLRHDDADLVDLIDAAFGTVAAVFAGYEPDGATTLEIDSSGLADPLP